MTTQVSDAERARETAARIFRQHRGTKADPRIVDAMLAFAALRDRPTQGGVVEREDRRSIESAPRDGTHILAWTDDAMPPVVVHYWDALGEEGFYLSLGASGEWDRPITLRDWMPLPVADRVNSDWAGDWQGDTLSERSHALASLQAGEAAPVVESKARKTLRQVMASGEPLDWPGGDVERDAWYAGYDAAVAEAGEDAPVADDAPTVREALAGLELTEDGYSLRVAYDGDADDEGRSIVVGGEIVATFTDSTDGEDLRDALLALLSTTAQGDGWFPLNRDQARLSLFQAIDAIKLGNPTDDKLILENLREAGVWLYGKGGCVNHPDRPVREHLDGDDLCQECCDAWARAEGAALSTAPHPEERGS